MSKDSPEQLRQMHMAYVLITEHLVDTLIAEETLHKQPRETQLSYRINIKEAFSSDTHLSSPMAKANLFPRSILGYYYCSKFSVYQIYKSQQLPPHCSTKSLNFSYCSSFSNTRDEQQPNYIPLSSTWAEVLLSVAGKLLHFRANKYWKKSCAMMAQCCMLRIHSVNAALEAAT